MTTETPVNVSLLIGTIESARRKLEKQTMFRVPVWLYRSEPDAYTPQYVAIGPLHHEFLGKSPSQLRHERVAAFFNRHKEPWGSRTPETESESDSDPRKEGYTLALMENYKETFMHLLLEHTSKDNKKETLDRCLEFLSWDTIYGVRLCYGGELYCDNHILKKIMLVDSFFLFEVMLFINYDLLRRIFPGWEPIQDVNRYRDDYNTIVTFVRRDMGLVENQFPYFVLRGLFEIVFHDLQLPVPIDNFLITLAANILLPRVISFDKINIDEGLLPNSIFRSKPLLAHIYNMYTALPQGQQPCQPNQQHGMGMRLSSATKLDNAGVKIVAYDDDMSFLGVKFQDGVLRIPTLYLNENTESLLSNLLAYEYVSSPKKECLASFVIFMAHLIDNKEDLILLETKRVIINEFGRAQDAIKIFYNISKNARVKNFYFQELCDKIEKHRMSRWHIYLQDLIQRHFKTPWRAISLSAATILLVLTLLQTIYAILDYKFHLKHEKK